MTRFRVSSGWKGDRSCFRDLVLQKNAHPLSLTLCPGQHSQDFLLYDKLLIEGQIYIVLHVSEM